MWQQPLWDLSFWFNMESLDFYREWLGHSSPECATGSLNWKVTYNSIVGQPTRGHKARVSVSSISLANLPEPLITRQIAVCSFLTVALQLLARSGGYLSRPRSRHKFEYFYHLSLRSSMSIRVLEFVCKTKYSKWAKGFRCSLYKHNGNQLAISLGALSLVNFKQFIIFSNHF